MRTEVDLSNPEERLYPGMYAEVSLEMNRRPDVLTVPAAAVGLDGDGNFVYTVNDDRMTRLAIKIGLTDNGQIYREKPWWWQTSRGRRHLEPRFSRRCSAKNLSGKIYQLVHTISFVAVSMAIRMFSMKGRLPLRLKTVLNFACI